MEEFLKIASNGQWTLEKAKNSVGGKSQEEVQRLIEEFKRKAGSGKQSPAAKIAEMGLRPVQSSAGANPKYSKEQVAAIREGLPAELAEATITGQKKPSAQEKHIASTQTKLEREQAEAEAKAKVGQSRKAAWEATAAFLANKGGEVKARHNPDVMGTGYGYGVATGKENKGWDNIRQNLETKKLLDEAARSGKGLVKPKRELMPPQEVGRDENDAPFMKEKVGTFHGQEDVPHDQKRFGYSNQPMQEIHHWAWDHNKKQWNHIRSSLGPTGG